MTDSEPDDGSSSVEGGSAELDARFSLLADRDRRLVLSTLAAAETDRVPVARLAEILSQAGSEERDSHRARISLHHRHLPRLQREDVLTYDDEAAVVRYHGDALLEQCLSSLEDMSSDTD